MKNKIKIFGPKNLGSENNPCQKIVGYKVIFGQQNLK